MIMSRGGRVCLGYKAKTLGLQAKFFSVRQSLADRVKCVHDSSWVAKVNST
jgi:hypothetical protein